MSDRARTLLLRGLVAAYLILLVGAPVGALLVSGLGQGWRGFWEALRAPQAQDALRLSLGLAALTAVVNGVTGLGLAWALARWHFPGRSLLSALIDLPLAIPTLVVGVVIVALFGPQTALGAALVGWGWPVAFARPGMVLALVFVTLPFVVRAVEPVIEELDSAEEEAALTLEASPWQIWWKVLLPPLLPAIGAGMVQTFARCVAEFGSLAAVSGNIPGRTLSIPVYILGEVEGGEAGRAAAISVLLLVLALILQALSIRLARGGAAP